MLSSRAVLSNSFLMLGSTPSFTRNLTISTWLLRVAQSNIQRDSKGKKENNQLKRKREGKDTGSRREGKGRTREAEEKGRTRKAEEKEKKTRRKKEAKYMGTEGREGESKQENHFREGTS